VLRSLLDAYLRRRFTWLLVLLVLALGVDPVLEMLGLRGRTLVWLLLFALGAALVGIWRLGGPRYLVVGSVISLLAWLVLRGVAPSLAAAALGVWSFLIAVGLLSVVLRAGRVDGERISAALSVYMLVGLAFGGFFATLEAVQPGSLRGAGAEVADAIYFSFVTLATLGYGDVLPVSRAARALAMLETVFGQLYLAVLIARLVSLYGRES
jgi:hypothetical protein